VRESILQAVELIFLCDIHVCMYTYTYTYTQNIFLYQ